MSDLDAIKAKLLKAKETVEKSDNEQLYHIHVNGHRVTDEPMSIKHIIKQHGPIKQLEGDGKTRLIPHKPEAPKKLVKFNEQGQWELLEKGIKDGFFNVEHLHAADKSSDHSSAKKVAHAAIDAQEGAHPSNKMKAKHMVDSSKSKKHLMIGMSNFMLSHPSQGLGMGTSKK